MYRVYSVIMTEIKQIPRLKILVLAVIQKEVVLWDSVYEHPVIIQLSTILQVNYFLTLSTLRVWGEKKLTCAIGPSLFTLLKQVTFFLIRDPLASFFLTQSDHNDQILYHIKIKDKTILSNNVSLFLFGSDCTTYQVDLRVV